MELSPPLMRRRRVVAYFQRPEDAVEAAKRLRGEAATARLRDAGRYEDAHAFAAIARLMMLGAVAGTVTGALLGLVVSIAFGAPTGPLVAIAAIGVGAFGWTSGLLSGAAIAEGKRSSGQGLALDALVEGDRAVTVEEALMRQGAADVQELPP